MNTLEFFWGGRSDDESPQWGGGTHNRMSGGSGVKALSQILSDESLSYSLKHISTGEHSSPISIFPIFKMTSWNGNMFRVTGPLSGEFTGHWWIPLTKASDAELWSFFICAWPNGWVNNQDADDLRRYHAHCDVTVMWCRIVIQWSGYHAYLAHCSTLLTIPWN